MSPKPWPCLTNDNGGALLALAVVPNAKRTEVVGLHDGALRVRLAARPIDGRANEALIAWLSAQLRVPRRSITLVRGDSSRRKQVRIAIEPNAVVRWLESIEPPIDRGAG